MLPRRESLRAIDIRTGIQNHNPGGFLHSSSIWPLFSPFVYRGVIHTHKRTALHCNYKLYTFCLHANSALSYTGTNPSVSCVFPQITYRFLSFAKSLRKEEEIRGSTCDLSDVYNQDILFIEFRLVENAFALFTRRSKPDKGKDQKLAGWLTSRIPLTPHVEKLNSNQRT